ncbi:MAG: hypothetical protein V4629_03840 [Pseudomonadota bacterium]
MLSLSLFSSILWLPAIAEDQIYRVKQADGTYLYTRDIPRNHPEAEPVDLPDPLIIKANENLEWQPEASSAPSLKPKLSVSSPSTGGTYQNEAADAIGLTWQSENIPSNLKIQLSLDGKIISPAPGTLPSLARGTHQIQIQAVNSAGNVVTSSDSIEIYVHRPSKRN